MHRKILISILALTSVGTQAFESISSQQQEEEPAPLLIGQEFEYNGASVFKSEAWPNEEIILNHLDTAEDSSTNPKLESDSHHLGVDRFCSSSNTVDGVCTIKDRTLRFSSDLFYKTDLSLVFDNTTVKCLTIAYMPCSLMVSLQGGPSTYIEFTNGSTITGKQIIIGATSSMVKIGADSTIIASGQSTVTAGTQENGLGATFSGQSGYCNEPKGLNPDNQKTYGFFNRLPVTEDLSKYDQEIGSIGKRNDVETAGGGRILIYADSVTFEGEGAKIEANARPYVDDPPRRYSLQGGSGGYIYIKTTNVSKNNTISNDSRVEAKGGYGVGDFTSGSGGVVVFDGNFNVAQDGVVVNGGVAASGEESGCGNGAAGTTYRSKDDSLVIDNKGIKVLAATTATIPKERQHNSSKGISELSKKLTVTGKARLIIKGEHYGLTFNNLYVFDESWVEFGQQDEMVHIRFTDVVQIAKTAVLDFTKTKYAMIFQGLADTQSPAESLTQIGTVWFREYLGIRGINVNIIGDIKVPSSEGVRAQENSLVGIESENLKIYPNVEIHSGFTLLHSNNTLEMMEGSKLTSAKRTMCNLGRSSSDMFTCMGKNQQQADKLDYMDVITRFKNQFPNYGNWEQATTMRLENIWGGLRSNYSQYIVSLGDAKLNKANIKGPRIGICAANVDLTDSMLDTSGQGCISDFGFGRGIKYATCAGSGGSNGGAGGAGGLESEVQAYQERCAGQVSQPYQYGTNPAYEGSGGASGTTSGHLGGSGGGIVRLLTLNNLQMRNSDIVSNGSDGTQGDFGSGGGAGGTINIQSRSLKGSSKISAEGGSGSKGGGGGGAGGRLVIHFNDNYKKDAQPDQSHEWYGSYSIDGGKNGEIDVSQGFSKGTEGQSGVIYADKCFGGYTGPFCTPCATGTYKYDYSYAICKTCENKPLNSFYTGTAATTSQCPYECSEGLDAKSVNQFCMNALELQVERLGGTVSSLLVFAGFMILVLFIWVALIAQSKYILRADKSFRSTVYDGVLFNTDAQVDEAEDIIGPRNLKMQDSDIWSHSHRMYLIGENSINFPWYVPKDFPSRALSPEDKDKFIRFVKSRQDVLDWTGLQKDTYVLSRILCPPLSNLIHRCFRRRHFTSLQDQLYQNFDASFWDTRNKGRTMRLSTSTTDNQLAFVDFMDYEKSKKDYIGPQLPLTLMLAGSGTFNSPYYVNFEDDALAKSIVYFNKATLKDSLPLWFENLNTLLSKTSFFKLTGAATKDLAQVIDWIEMGNKTLFNPLDTKATLYLFENSYQAVEQGTFKQRRRSFPLESLVFEAFPELFTSLLRFVKTKLMARKSEIRLGLVFRPYNDEKRRKMLDRIRRITQQQKQDEDRLSGRVFEQGTSNLIFGSDDEDNAEDDQKNQFSYAKSNMNKFGKSKNTLGDIRRGQNNETHSELLEETNMESSEVYIYGSGKEGQQVKIIDKSKRAYDIGPDAVKSLELTLQKPRTSCKNRCLRFRAWWYAIWVLFFKHHGIPPKAGTRYQYFLGYSVFLALDTMMTANITLHMFQPLDNWKLYGIPFFFICPFVSVLGPLLGIIGCLFASPKTLKLQASVNATCVVLNYPLTIALMIVKKDEPFYVAQVILLWFNTICLSYFGAKVRQHLLNPGFCRNAEKIEDRFNSYIQAKQEVDAGVKPGMTAAERAANLASYGPPGVGNDSDNDDDEDDTSYGIIPKNRLEPVKDERQELSDF